MSYNKIHLFQFYLYDTAIMHKVTILNVPESAGEQRFPFEPS